METAVDGPTVNREEPDPDARKSAAFEAGMLDGYIAYHLRLAQNASFRAFQRKTGQHDLKPGWFAVLSLIGDNPGITPMTLSRGSGRDKSTLTPVLRDMLAGGYIERIASTTDRRSYGLTADRCGPPTPRRTFGKGRRTRCAPRCHRGRQQARTYRAS
jgi:hypothetical protein